MYNICGEHKLFQISGTMLRILTKEESLMKKHIALLLTIFTLFSGCSFESSDESSENASDDSKVSGIEFITTYGNDDEEIGKLIDREFYSHVNQALVGHTVDEDFGLLETPITFTYRRTKRLEYTKNEVLEYSHGDSDSGVCVYYEVNTGLIRYFRIPTDSKPSVKAVANEKEAEQTLKSFLINNYPDISINDYSFILENKGYSDIDKLNFYRFTIQKNIRGIIVEQITASVLETGIVSYMEPDSLGDVSSLPEYTSEEYIAAALSEAEKVHSTVDGFVGLELNAEKSYCTVKYLNNIRRYAVETHIVFKVKYADYNLSRNATFYHPYGEEAKLPERELLIGHIGEHTGYSDNYTNEAINDFMEVSPSEYEKETDFKDHKRHREEYVFSWDGISAVAVYSSSKRYESLGYETAYYSGDSYRVTVNTTTNEITDIYLRDEFYGDARATSPLSEDEIKARMFEFIESVNPNIDTEQYSVLTFVVPDEWNGFEEYYMQLEKRINGVPVSTITIESDECGNVSRMLYKSSPYTDKIYDITGSCTEGYCKEAFENNVKERLDEIYGEGKISELYLGSSPKPYYLKDRNVYAVGYLVTYELKLEDGSKKDYANLFFYVYDDQK